MFHHGLTADHTDEPAITIHHRQFLELLLGEDSGHLSNMLVGWWMALGYLGAGVLNCITIIGIPFGLQSFKMAKLALWPFGAEIVNL